MSKVNINLTPNSTDTPVTLRIKAGLLSQAVEDHRKAGDAVGVEIYQKKLDEIRALQVALSLRYGDHLPHCCQYCTRFTLQTRSALYKHGAKGCCEDGIIEGTYEGRTHICQEYDMDEKYRKNGP